MICCLHILPLWSKQGDAFRAVEASERTGVHLWLRCRLALFQSLAAEVSHGVPPLQGDVTPCPRFFYVQFMYFMTKQPSNTTKMLLCLPVNVLLVVFKGKTREALQVLQDALDECTRWGEPDVQGLLMFEGAKLEVQRGQTGNGLAMLKVPKQTHTRPTTGFSNL